MFASKRLASRVPKAAARFSTAAFADTDVVVVAAARTPLGSFNGGLASLSGVQLGSHAIKAAVARAGIKPEEISEVIMGNVISANLGQAPARQAAIGAGLPESVISTTVNKVCSSGLKAIMYAANEIKLGNSDIVVAGGFESMTNAPYYAPALRQGARIGDSSLVDGLMKDGLTDAYGKYPMGNCAEVCAHKMEITRAAQDDFAEQSYRRAQAAIEAGKFVEEIAPVTVKTRKGESVVAVDEEAARVNFDAIRTVKPAFKHPTVADAARTVTAANASVLSDGGAALVLTSGKIAKEKGLPVKARILAHADFEHSPDWFTTAPATAVTRALAKAGVPLEKVDKFELNEAFAVVALANQQLLNLDASKVNVYGGAVSLGHPLGASGARIAVTLLSALKQDSTGSKVGVAAICNGGGGASAVVFESLE